MWFFLFCVVFLYLVFLHFTSSVLHWTARTTSSEAVVQSEEGGEGDEGQEEQREREREILAVWMNAERL